MTICNSGSIFGASESGDRAVSPALQPALQAAVQRFRHIPPSSQTLDTLGLKPQWRANRISIQG
ncbi:hypothetical protein NG799_18670 [Laspinema sp. D1]|uniref:Uncharacterized protein n=1 Tax=Laspinema palackyanum D2a TaxID=2953684 RepID=A0ABT2MUA4_9CYAN|nr:hypothetical protein [Laspinema sp. D2b]MCT7968339.1 hypothetical protein [Laspinema sp. D2a]